MLAIMELANDDDSFYFNETMHHWIDADDLKVWTSPDWEMSVEDRFPLTMLAKAWGLKLGRIIELHATFALHCLFPSFLDQIKFLTRACTLLMVLIRGHQHEATYQMDAKRT